MASGAKRWAALAAVIGVVALGATAWVGYARFRPGSSAASVRTVTFDRHIAPIVFQNCSGCHRPGEAAPFSLLSYQDVRKHATQIAEVTRSRQMPPWQPDPADPACGPFANERRLTDDQITLINRWAAEGQVEGDASDLPPAPPAAGGWQLGTPDVIARMPAPYTLPADGEAGKDVYRNFVVPVTLPAGPQSSPARYVRAVEIHPGNPKVVHHLFVMTDSTGEGRRLDRKDAEPGYPGMSAGDGPQSPGGHLLSWQPGRTPVREPEDLAWRIDPGTDIVLQVHMRPSGKPEPVQIEVGLYFTDKPPTRQPFNLLLRSTAIDIPPGESNYPIEASYTLPVDVELMAALPHAHYLGKDLKAWATLPDGSRRNLIRIRDWDFNWQSEYRYAKPVVLPRGTVLQMRYTYDNSAANPRNPSSPPKRVMYGLNTSDEMGEMWLQVVPRLPQNFDLLRNDYFRKWGLPDTIAQNQALLKRDPNDALARTKLATALVLSGYPDMAMGHLRQAVASRPDSVEAHYALGALLARRNDTARARAEWETVLRLDPDHYKAHGDLGYLLLTLHENDAAIQHLERAAALRPADGLTHVNLGRAYLTLDRTADAVAQFEAALKIDPNNVEARAELEHAKGAMK
jgi:tetratricopeptide (TPR) repeat protein/mono/diheme cytochrome c family protein